MTEHKHNEEYCYQESRISALEARFDNNNEDIHSIHKDYYLLREKIDDLNMNVTKLTTLLEAEQRHEEENDKKIELLQQELNETTQELKGLTSSISTLKWLVGLGVPILVVILTFLLNHFI